MLKLKLDKPLAIFDIEATGVAARADRIVEICILKIMPDGTESTHTFRTNPTIPIPIEAINIHGISNEDIKDCPTFVEIAPQINELLKDCDLAGYNLIRFDIPMLVEEFMRADIKFDLNTRRVIDSQVIFHKQEPRTLSAALSFYCNEEHIDAHGAEPDVKATFSVLKGQLKKYPDLPTNVQELDKYCSLKKPEWVDKTGKFKWHNNEIILNFSKKKGALLKDMIQNDAGFINWMLKSDFPRDVHELIQSAIEGNWPEPPSTS